MTAAAEHLFQGADWDFPKLQRIHDACEEIARTELGLDTYPNQIEVITAEQMLDAYSSVGMPLFYKHWSFGKHFAHHETFYRGPPVGSVHRCRCHRLAVVLRRSGISSHRPDARPERLQRKTSLPAFSTTS
jgi:SpoVR like protein